MPGKKALHYNSSKEEFKTVLGFKWEFNFEALWKYIKENVQHKPWYLMEYREQLQLKESIERFCADKAELPELLLDPHTGRIKEDDIVPNALEALFRKASKQLHEKREKRARQSPESEVRGDAEAGRTLTARPFYDPARGSAPPEGRRE